jgi:hypothetical protein
MAYSRRTAIAPSDTVVTGSDQNLKKVAIATKTPHAKKMTVAQRQKFA